MGIAEKIFLSEPPQRIQANAFYQRGKHYFLEKEYNKAITCFEQSLSIIPKDVDALAELASCYHKIGNITRALAHYRRAMQFTPENPKILSGLANCHTSAGNFEKATTYYKKILQLAPNSAHALYRMIFIRPYSLHSWPAKQLQRMYNEKNYAHPSHKLVCFALGKLYEDNARYGEAFPYYEEGNRLEFIHTSYDEAEYFNFFDSLQNCFKDKNFAAYEHSGLNCTTPIFVLGMPRSGTSLVEQILASHSKVSGAGETDIIPHMAERLIPKVTGKSYPQALHQLTPQSYRELAEHYLNEMQPYYAGGKHHVVDKTTSNFFHIGLIHQMFPQAKIIHCVRDPMDTCWSLYRQSFGGNHPYCYDQATLGKYYRRYQQLMQHWHTVLPGKIYEVSYEQMVKEPEVTIRSLLDHCQLPWEEKCMAFYRTKRSVSTSSMRQVRLPIYNTSVKSWLPVEKELYTLQESLQH